MALIVDTLLLGERRYTGISGGVFYRSAEMIAAIMLPLVRLTASATQMHVATPVTQYMIDNIS